uniref:Calcineurin-like phosphoesterase domain-containing protein n=1 Tax=Arcella intermedia TaxID=1963864 RepID=A0A6B2LBD7_9EUKA
MEEKCLFSFGAIADVQYADAPDGWDFHKTALRRYRNSLVCLKEAVDCWESGPPIQFVVQLGDLLDGLCRRDPHPIVNMLLKQFKNYDVHNLVGNHELYNFRREEINSILNVNRPVHDSKRAYYEFSPYEGWRFVALDSYDLCTIQEDTKQEALRYLKQYNPNDVDNYGVDWTKGLEGASLKYLPYNGGLSQKQLDWLTEVLARATQNKEKVILLTHIPLAPDSAAPQNILWNSEEALRIVYSFRCVVACLAGHDHKGGYTLDDHGIHHLTFFAPLEVPQDQNAFGTIHVYPNKLLLAGNGLIPSRTLPFRE